MRLIQAVSVMIGVKSPAKADMINIWACIETATVGTCRRMLPRKDVRYSGNVMLPTSSKHIVSQGRTYHHPLSVHFLGTELKVHRSAINPEHCDTAFPSEPLRPNGEKSYSILRFELSQLSSE